MSFVGFRDQCARDEGAETHTEFQFLREQCQAEAKSQDGDEQGFVALETADKVHQSRDDEQTQHDQGDQEHDQTCSDSQD